MSSNKRVKLSQEKKSKILKLLAELYLKEGFGYPNAQKLIWNVLNYRIECNTYNNFMGTIMRMTFRNLEDFIYKECEMPIRPITSKEQSIIRSFMTQSKTWMKDSLLQTFLKFVIKTYNLASEVQISIEQAKNVYKQFRNLIDKKYDCKAIIKQKKKLKQIEKIQSSLQLHSQQTKQQKISQKDIKKQYQQSS